MKISFRQKVYEIAKRIPRSKVATYGQLAKMAGNPKAERAVGMFMKQNPDLSAIPCHRVVAANGDLTGYSAGRGVFTKKEILLKEGVSFIKEKINLSVSHWKPS